MNKTIYSILFIILLSALLYSQNDNSIENKMKNYEKKIKLKWKYNPLRVYETDKYFLLGSTLIIITAVFGSEIF